MHAVHAELSVWKVLDDLLLAEEAVATAHVSRSLVAFQIGHLVCIEFQDASKMQRVCSLIGRQKRVADFGSPILFG
jgi:hypothetical protein